VVAIAVLVGSLQGYALSLAGLRRQVDPHWKRGMSFLRIGLGALQMLASDATRRLMAWLPIPLQELEPCIPAARHDESKPRPGSHGLSCHHDRDQPTVGLSAWLSRESQA
jgi:hypothetical protein